MSESSTVTRETIEAGSLRENGHADAEDWFGVLYQHTTIPRLQAMDKHPRRGPARGSSERIWSVDGAPCANLGEAIGRLNVPAVLTDQEAEVLAQVPAEWIELAPFRTRLGEELGRPIGVTIIMLRQKGAIQNELRPGPERRQPWIRLSPTAALATREAARG